MKLIKFLGAFAIIGLITIIALIFWRFYLSGHYNSTIYTSPDTIPPHKVAIVLGAAAHNSQPSDVLKERLLAAITLYQSGKAEKLLMSGDNRFSHYNEPEVMRDYAIKKGVPSNDIVLDYAGRRTYDTCYRAKHIFQLDKAIIVTNGFHVPRTLYLCESLGIDVVGYNADIWEYPTQTTNWWQIRETIATAFAWSDVNILSPSPILGDPLPIKP